LVCTRPSASAANRRITSPWSYRLYDPSASYRRARLSALAGGGASGAGFEAASNLARAARSGSRRGA
jgi:hypothetical protein